MKLLSRPPSAPLAPPEGKFDPQDQRWLDYCFTLASTLDLNVRDVAAKCQVNFNTFVSYPGIRGVIAAGRADFKTKVMQEFVGFILAEPNDYADPMERNQVRAQKLDAVKHWTKLEQKREEMAGVERESEANRQFLSTLSTEELKQKALELLK